MLGSLGARGPGHLRPRGGDFATNTLGEPVHGVTVEDLTVTGFTGFGVFSFNAEDVTVARVRARDNQGYGISGFVLSGVHYLDNVAIGNGEPGFYVGDSPDAQAVLIGNTSIRNGVGGGEGFGFLLRDSSHGAVIGNRATRNCVGFVFIDTGENPDALTDWTTKGNTATRNNGACPGSTTDPIPTPATSGTGIWLAGAAGTTVTRNHVFGNRSPSTRRSPAASW